MKIETFEEITVNPDNVDTETDPIQEDNVTEIFEDSSSEDTLSEILKCLESQQLYIRKIKSMTQESLEYTKQSNIPFMERDINSLSFVETAAFIGILVVLYAVIMSVMRGGKRNG